MFLNSSAASFWLITAIEASCLALSLGERMDNLDYVLGLCVPLASLSVSLSDVFGSGISEILTDTC